MHGKVIIFAKIMGGTQRLFKMSLQTAWNVGQRWCDLRWADTQGPCLARLCCWSTLLGRGVSSVQILGQKTLRKPTLCKWFIPGVTSPGRSQTYSSVSCGHSMRTPKPPLWDTCKRPICLRTLLAQLGVHKWDISGGPTSPSRVCLHVCWYAQMCMGMCVLYVQVCGCDWIRVCACECVCSSSREKSLRKTAWDHLVSHHISRFIAPLLWENISQ